MKIGTEPTSTPGEFIVWLNGEAVGILTRIRRTTRRNYKEPGSTHVWHCPAGMFRTREAALEAMKTLVIG